MLYAPPEMIIYLLVVANIANLSGQKSDEFRYVSASLSGLRSSTNVPEPGADLGGRDALGGQRLPPPAAPRLRGPQPRFPRSPHSRLAAQFRWRLAHGGLQTGLLKANGKFTPRDGLLPSTIFFPSVEFPPPPIDGPAVPMRNGQFVS